MNNSIENMKADMDCLIFEARQASRAITSVSMMTEEWISGGRNDLTQEEIVYDAMWIMRCLVVSQRESLEKLEDKVRAIKLVESPQIDSEAFSDER